MKAINGNSSSGTYLLNRNIIRHSFRDIVVVQLAVIRDGGSRPIRIKNIEDTHIVSLALFMIAHAISNPPGSRPCDTGGSCGPEGLVVIAQSANGSVANVNGIERGKLESGFVQSDIAYWAYTGTGTFNGDPPKRELRAIARSGQSTWSRKPASTIASYSRRMAFASASR